MTIYLVRHGEARPEVDDASRALSERGRAEIERVARLVATLRPPVAEILAAALGPARGVRAAQGLAPGDEPAVAAAECEAATEPILLVSHMPHLGRLASQLLIGEAGRELIRFETGTVACLSRAERGWVVEWLITPRLSPPGGAP
jgi:phosphohistidine phosphatase